jgi:ferritin-like metal-binding protein YciE
MKMQNSVFQNTHSRLRRFFIDSLKDIYYAEQQLVKALNTLWEKATSDALKEAFEDHRQVTMTHVSRLEEIFGLLEVEPKIRKCEAIKGIISEANSIIDDTENDTLTRDAALIFAAQKAEHYEIATYGTLVQYARVIGLNDVSWLLEQTLQEEKEADSALTEIAEGFVNIRALQEEEK